jgi:hypothetical protein
VGEHDHARRDRDQGKGGGGQPPRVQVQLGPDRAGPGKGQRGRAGPAHRAGDQDPAGPVGEHRRQALGLPGGQRGGHHEPEHQHERLDPAGGGDEQHGGHGEERVHRPDQGDGQSRAAGAELQQVDH